MVIYYQISQVIAPPQKKKGPGLCPVNFFTGHNQIWTRVHSWTRVQDPMCPVKKFTGPKPCPKKKISKPIIRKC